jgi:hypothetical protein
MRAMGSPKAAIPFDSSPMAKTARVNRNLATSPRPSTAVPRNAGSPSLMAQTAASSLRTIAVTP